MIFRFDIAVDKVQSQTDFTPPSLLEGLWEGTFTGAFFCLDVPLNLGAGNSSSHPC
jgi:hypothetical protein